MRLYTVQYTDMRHGWHAVSVASDLHMYAVCCMVREHVWLCDLLSWGVDVSVFVHVAVGAL